MPKMNKIVMRRREPDEIPTALVAFRNHCLECCGYSPREVAECTAPECWLFPWRFGRTPDELKGRRRNAKGRPETLRHQIPVGIIPTSTPQESRG